jgi:rhodanese-related sulfurtransferase
VKRQTVSHPDAVFFDAIFFLALKYGRGYIVDMNLFSKGANNMNNMMTNELEQKLQQDETIQLIDVREPDEYAGGHIKQAKNVPLSELTERTNELDPSRPLHVICLSGGRSMNAAMYLEQAGFDVTNVDGGMMSWEGNITR